jgi:transcriptional regulator with GAF, ATPase, and Fis domain
VLRLELSMPHVREARPVDITPVAQRITGILTEKEMREYQKQNLIAALEETNWRVSGPDGAAELLGVKPTTLADRIRSFGVRRPAR